MNILLSHLDSVLNDATLSDAEKIVRLEELWQTFTTSDREASSFVHCITFTLIGAKRADPEPLSATDTIRMIRQERHHVSHSWLEKYRGPLVTPQGWTADTVRAE